MTMHYISSRLPSKARIRPPQCGRHSPNGLTKTAVARGISVDRARLPGQLAYLAAGIRTGLPGRITARLLERPLPGSEVLGLRIRQSHVRRNVVRSKRCPVFKLE